MPMLYFPVGAYALAPQVVLGWIGAPHETVQVPPGYEDSLVVNPAGTVPTLCEDDGLLLTQAGSPVRVALREGPAVQSWEGVLPVPRLAMGFHPSAQGWAAQDAGGAPTGLTVLPLEKAALRTPEALG